MNWLVPLPVALPLLVAAGLVAAAPVRRRRLIDSVSIATTFTIMCVCLWLAYCSAGKTIVYWFGNWVPHGRAAIGISFVIDPLGAGMAAFCAFLMTMALIYAAEYFDAVRTYFHALMLLFIAAMAGFCLTGDLFNLFVFFELMSVTAYALTAYKIEEEQAAAGAMNFAVTNSVGGFMTLMGIGLVYGRTGALNMAQAGESLARHPADALVAVALTLIVCGFFIKAAVMPFHFWLADAHAVAPTPVCVLFSGVMIELGLYGSFRVYWIIFHPSLTVVEGRIRLLLLILGAVTAVLGAVMCFAQRHLKRLLAFSSISHVGIMLIGAGCLTAKGLAGAALYILGHGMVKGALFMGAGILLNQFGTVDELELAGRGRRFFVLGSIFAIGGLGLAGFPPFGPYLGKQIMEEAGGAIGQHWFLWIFLFSSAVTGGAVLRVAGMVFLGWGGPTEEAKSPTRPDRRETTAKGIPTVMLTAAAILVLAPLCFVIIGNPLAEKTEAAAQRFIDQHAYVETVLGGVSTGPIHSDQPSKITMRGIVFGLAAAGGAVGFAFLGLFGSRLPTLVVRAVRFMIDPLMDVLDKIHSGRIGDQIVWVMIGVVAIGLSLALFLPGAAAHGLVVGLSENIR